LLSGSVGQAFSTLLLSTNNRSNMPYDARLLRIAVGFDAALKRHDKFPQMRDFLISRE